MIISFSLAHLLLDCRRVTFAITEYQQLLFFISRSLGIGKEMICKINVTGYRYITHLYCLAVQAGFYSDVVESRTLSPADRIRSLVGEKCYFHFFTYYIWRPPWAFAAIFFNL